METIPKNDCLKIGYLQKPHGIQGEIVLQMETGYAASVEEEPTLFVEIDGLLVPFFIQPDGVRFRSDDSALVHFEWIENEEQAREICGQSVYIKKEEYYADEEEVSLHMLVGYKLFDAKLGYVGEIEKVDDFAGNLIFQLEYKGEIILVPFNEDFLIRLDPDSKEIELNCPDGIFDLN